MHKTTSTEKKTAYKKIDEIMYIKYVYDDAQMFIVCFDIDYTL